MKKNKQFDLWEHIKFKITKHKWFFIIWIGLAVLAYLWLMKHPECTTMILSNMREVNGTFFYLENSSGIPELVNPPCAWYVYHLITVARPYLLMSAVILLIIEYIRKREKVHAWIKKFRET